MEAGGVSSQSPKHATFDCFAEVAKALRHGRPLEILELLAQGERSVEALAEVACRSPTPPSIYG